MSHGLGSVEDNVRMALKKGLKRVGIADHGPAHMAYGVRNLKQYFSEITRVKEKYAGQIEVWTGLEFNLTGLQGETDWQETLQDSLDFSIVGYHKFIRPASMGAAWHFYITKHFKNSAHALARTTDAYIAALSTGRFKFVVHPGYGILVDIPALAAACREYDVWFEINNSHKELSPSWLETAANQGAKFVLSSDAHQPDKVGCFETALEKACAAGLTEREIVNLEVET